MAENTSNMRRIVTTATKLSPEAAAAAFRIQEMEQELKNNAYFEKYKGSMAALKQNWARLFEQANDLVYF